MLAMSTPSKDCPMPTLPRLRLLNIAIIAVIVHGSAHAINGAQLGGSGIKNAAMGGAGIALPLDASAAANNPAGMAFVPTSASVGVQVFRGHSTADYVQPGNLLENRQTLPAPEGGLNVQLSSAYAVGFSIAGSGVGSDYGRPALPVPGAGTAETTLRIVEFIPAVAWRPRQDIALGMGLTIAHQQFKANGIVVPAPVSGGLVPLPEHGTKSSNGVGWRAGVLWKPTADWSIGANFKARTHMGRLDGYAQDLLEYSDGHLDIPKQYGVGVAWQPTHRLTVAADWLDIRWGDIKAMQDPNGFGWRNQRVLRLGASWALNEQWTLRLGASRNQRQIDSARTVQNFLVPSIHNHAYTAGLSWRVDSTSELNLGYELNPRTTLAGTAASAGTNLTSKVQLFMLGYQRAF
jgi:long-chain fatty acid transport protein